MLTLQEALRDGHEISLQDIVSKVSAAGPNGEKSGLKKVQETMDRTHAAFHPEDASILDQPGLSKADAADIVKTLHNVPLRKLCEFLGVGSGSGTSVGATAGAGYLIPDKINDVLWTAAYTKDIVPEVCRVYDMPGSNLRFDIEKYGQFRPYQVAPGGEMPDNTMEVVQSNVTPILFQIKPAMTNELLEDANFDMMEVHIRRAGEEMGQFASRLMVDVMITAGNGDGTQLAISSKTASYTYLGDLAKGWGEVGGAGWLADRALVAPQIMAELLTDATVSAYSDQFHTRATNESPTVFGDFMGMKLVVPYGTPTTLTSGSGALYLSSKWHSFVWNYANAFAAVRKRWLKIEKYSDPIQDLVGAVITARQGVTSVYNNASCEITES